MQFCFSPLDRNRHTTIDELYKWNDVELFDLDKDPEEMVNLGADNTRNRDLIVPMNAKLEALIKAEIGVDDGRELPNILLVSWTIDKVSRLAAKGLSARRVASSIFSVSRLSRSNRHAGIFPRRAFASNRAT